MRIYLYAIDLWANTSTLEERIDYLVNCSDNVRVHNSQYVVDFMTDLYYNVTDFELKDWSYSLAVL